MIRAIEYAAVVMFSMVFAGCSTGPTQPDFEAADRYDIEKMREVNAQAHVLGTHVIWVNPPQARKPGGEPGEAYDPTEQDAGTYDTTTAGEQ